jgi:hypothetical protein
MPLKLTLISGTRTTSLDFNGNGKLQQDYGAWVYEILEAPNHDGDFRRRLEE